MLKTLAESEPPWVTPQPALKGVPQLPDAWDGVTPVGPDEPDHPWT